MRFGHLCESFFPCQLIGVVLVKYLLLNGISGFQCTASCIVVGASYNHLVASMLLRENLRSAINYCSSCGPCGLFTLVYTILLTRRLVAKFINFLLLLMLERDGWFSRDSSFDCKRPLTIRKQMALIPQTFSHRIKRQRSCKSCKDTTVRFHGGHWKLSGAGEASNPITFEFSMYPNNYMLLRFIKVLYAH